MLISTQLAPLAMDYFGPAISAVLFVLIMSFVPEPTRRTFNAIFATGAAGVYVKGMRIVTDEGTSMMQGPMPAIEDAV